MRKYLSSGAMMEITTLDNGDTAVDITCPPRDYYSIEEGRKEKEQIINEALGMLKREGIIKQQNRSPFYSDRRSIIPPMEEIERLSKHLRDEPHFKSGFFDRNLNFENTIAGRESPINYKATQAKQQKKGKKAAKVVQKSPAPKPPGYTWQPKEENNEQIPKTVSTYGVTPTKPMQDKMSEPKIGSVSKIKPPPKQSNNNEKFGVTTLSPNNELITWMKEEEGTPILNEPKNVKGDATIGWGHLIHRGPVTKSDRKKYKGYSLGDAERDFKKDLQEQGVEPVQRDIKVKLTQYQFNALVDFAYNSGRNTFYKSYLLNATNNSESNPGLITPEKVVEYLGVYKRAFNRKMDEATLFNTGKYVVTRTKKMSKKIKKAK